MFTAAQENWLIDWSCRISLERMCGFTAFLNHLVLLGREEGKQFICQFLSVSCITGQSSPHGALTAWESHWRRQGLCRSWWSDLCLDPFRTIIAPSGVNMMAATLNPSPCPSGREDDLCVKTQLCQGAYAAIGPCF